MIEKWRQVAPSSNMRNPKKTAPNLAWLTHAKNQPGQWYVNHTRILRVDGTSAADLTRAYLEGQLQALELVEQFYRPHVGGFANCFIASLAPFVGVRETRHILGDYVLNEQDVMEFRKFPDAIACSAYPIDLHDPAGAGGVHPVEHFDKHAGEFYQIPYRCITPQKVDNLLTAGKCISATHEAAGSFRTIGGCMALGHAAGCAAALSAAENKTPRQLGAKPVQEALVRDGAFLGL